MRLEATISRLSERILLANGRYEYVHDPEHRNKPRGQFWPTDKGWSNDPKDRGLKEDNSDYNINPSKMTDYSKFKYKQVELTDEQRAEYPPITIDRGGNLQPLTSTFVGGKDTKVSRAEAHQINKASDMFLAYAYENEEKYDDGQEVQTYVENEIPVAIREGKITDVKSQTFTFHPSEDIIHNIKFFEFLDKVNPNLTQKLLDSSYLAPHEQTPKSIQLADSIHQIDNGDLAYKPRFG